MKILLLSDTHGYLDEAILRHVKWSDEVWHAGDIGSTKVTDSISQLRPLVAVYGNIDGTEIRKEFPKDQIFSREGVRVWMTHIGGYPGRFSAGIREELKRLDPQLFICGHSHILKVMKDPDSSVLHMNPGACGRHGFHQLRTMLRFELRDGAIESLEVVELGPRSRK
jgi:hypothetical protein